MMDINEEYPIKMNITHCGECGHDWSGQDNCPICNGIETNGNQVFVTKTPREK